MAPFNNDPYGVAVTTERNCRDYNPPNGSALPFPAPNNPPGGHPVVVPVISSTPAPAADRPRGVSPPLQQTFPPLVTGPPATPPTATPQPWAHPAGIASGYGQCNGFEQPHPMPPQPWVGGAAWPPPGVYNAAPGPMAGSVPPTYDLSGTVGVNGTPGPDMWNVNPSGSLGGIPPAGAAPLAPFYSAQPPPVPNGVRPGTADGSFPSAWSNVRR